MPRAKRTKKLRPRAHGSRPRIRITATMAIAFLLLCGGAAAQKRAGKWVVEPFDYQGVTLDDGMLRRQVDEVREFYLRIPNDDLLRGFRQRAIRPAPGLDLGGWYSADIGNVFGQIVSGLARLHRATGDPACLAKANALVSDWGRCIGSDGFPFYSQNPAGAAYTYDKLVGGLVDVILYTGHKEAPVYLGQITDWAERNLNRAKDYANADGAGMPRAAWAEWYTLGENLYRAFLATGERRYRDFASVWEYDEFWDLLAAKGDLFGPRPGGETTDSYHAYSHVNSLSSAAAAYEVKGEARYLETLKSAYDYLLANQCFATGGYGPDEALVPRDELLRRLAETHNTVETQCCSWAGFKLGRYLILFTGDARYGDWIERLLYNGVDASLPNAADGRVFYYSDYNPRGAKKVLYDTGWACCSGTRPMAVASACDLIYFKDQANLYVNLYTPSTVRWNGVTVRQRTRFPEAETAEFLVETKKPAVFGLNLRAPGWLAGSLAVTVNGRRVEAPVGERRWATVKREWRDGDILTVTLPMGFRSEALDPKGHPAAICYGPVVMAVRSPEENPAARMDLRKLNAIMIPSPGEPLTFHLHGDDNVLIRPFYAIREGETYFLYLDPAAK